MYTKQDMPLDPGDFHSRIYRAEIFHFKGMLAIGSLIAFAQDFLENAFHPYSPSDIHRHCCHAEQVELFATQEKEFSQSKEVKHLWRAVFEAVGLDPSRLAGDRLHLRFQPHQQGCDLAEAILWHGGEAEKSREKFRTTAKPERDALIAFLNSL